MDKKIITRWGGPAAALALVLAGIVYLFKYEAADPCSAVPEPEEVETMRATLKFSPHSKADLPWFEVPKEHIAPILAALRPCERDLRPKKWVVAGEIEMALRDDRQVTIELFWVNQDIGAFATGPSWQERAYFRPGSNVAIEEALRAAYPR
jgi:hypothetical protein